MADVPISAVITISITKQTTGITRVGFGYGLCLAKHANSLNRVEWITKATWATELAALGFTSSDAVYAAISDHFAQSPCPTKVALGRIQGTRVTVAIDTVQNTTDYTIYIESVTAGTLTEHKYTSDASALQSEIADGLVALINAGAEAANVTASNVGDDVQIDLDGSSPMVVTIPSAQSSLMSVGQVAGTLEDADTALTAIVGEDSDWYGIFFIDTEGRTVAQQEKVADWAESNKRLYIAATADANVPGQTVAVDATTIAHHVKSNSLAQTGVIYLSAAATEYPDAAWLGRCLPQKPGGINWAYKTLASITVDDLTATQAANIHNKYAASYETMGGVNVTRYGGVGDGDFLDITRGVNWLQVRLEEYIFGLLATEDKVPYTDKGIAAVVAKMKKGFELGITNNFLISYIIQAPTAASISTEDKAARLLDNIKFTAIASGVINKVNIAGEVTY